MVVGFKWYLNRVVELRVAEISDHVNQECGEYLTAQSELGELHQKVMDLLPEEHKELVNQIEEKESQLMGILENHQYLFGLRDGTWLASFLVK